jgi:replicative DNA helicase
VSAAVQKLDSFGTRMMRAKLRDPEGSPPPADEECERAVLADLLRPDAQGVDALDAVRGFLTPKDFSKASHGAAYEAVCGIRDDQAERGLRPSPIGHVELAIWMRTNLGESEVLRELSAEERELFRTVDQTRTWVEQLCDSSMRSNKVHARAKRIKRLAEMRATLRRIWDTAAVACSADTELFDGAIADLSTHLADAVAPETTDMEQIASPLQRVFTRYITNCHTPVDGLATGFPDLDRVVSLDPGDLVVIGGHPGRGKSSLAMQLAIHIGKTAGQVLYFSAEMSNESLALRAACTDAKVDSAKVRQKKLDAAEMGKLTKSINELSKCFTWICDRSGIDVARICGIARVEAKRLLREHKSPVKMIVVDYLQRVSPGRIAPHGSSREVQVGAIAEAFKNLAMELECVVVVPAQLNSDNRKRDDERPDAEDMRESKRITQEADKILLLHNPCYEDRVRMLATGQTPPPENCEVIVGKNRGGSLGTVHMWFAPVFTAFKSMNPEDQERFVQQASAGRHGAQQSNAKASR